MRRRWIIGLVVVVLLCGVCAAIPTFIRLPSGPPGAGGLGAGGPSGASRASLQTAIIDKGDLRATVSATGNVVANTQSDLTFDQSGKVVEVLVKEGDSVRAGQLLARLDDKSAQSSLQQAEYSVAAAQAALNKLLKPVDSGDIANAEADVKSAQASYSSKASGTNPNTIKAYELKYQQAAANAQSQQTLANGAGGQYSKDDPKYQKAVAQVGEAQFNAEIARLNWQQQLAGSSLEESTANIAYYQAKLAQVKAGTKQTDIDTAQANLATAQVQRDQAKHDVAKTQLVAPFDGVITTINAKANEVISDTAMTISDTNTLYVDVNVDESDISKIQVGQPVELTLDALSGATLTGKVARIAPYADSSASVISYKVHVTLDKTDAAIKVDMTANVVFIISDVHDVVRVPNEYLRQKSTTGQTTVYLVDVGGNYTEIALQTGVEGTDYTEVISGLNPGDTVALVNDSTATQ